MLASAKLQAGPGATAAAPYLGAACPRGGRWAWRRAPAPALALNLARSPHLRVQLCRLPALPSSVLSEIRFQFPSEQLPGPVTIPQSSVCAGGTGPRRDRVRGPGSRAPVTGRRVPRPAPPRERWSRERRGPFKSRAQPPGGRGSPERRAPQRSWDQRKSFLPTPAPRAAAHSRPGPGADPPPGPGPGRAGPGRQFRFGARGAAAAAGPQQEPERPREPEREEEEPGRPATWEVALPAASPAPIPAPRSPPARGQGALPRAPGPEGARGRDTPGPPAPRVPGDGAAPAGPDTCSQARRDRRGPG